MIIQQKSLKKYISSYFEFFKFKIKSKKKNFIPINHLKIVIDFKKCYKNESENDIFPERIDNIKKIKDFNIGNKFKLTKLRIFYSQKNNNLDFDNRNKKSFSRLNYDGINFIF